MVIVRPTLDIQYYLDGFLKQNLDALKQTIKKDYDAFLIISGDERIGKSTFGAQIAKYLDPSYNLDRCCFTAEQFLYAVEAAQKYQAVVFDEAYGYLSSRGALSRFNRTLIKVMTEMGSKNLFVIIILPNFFELDRYPAIHRSVGLLRVYRRGKFALYDKVRKKKLYLVGKKFYEYRGASPNFIGSFTSYFPFNKEYYEEKKRKSVLPTKDLMENLRENKQMIQRNKLMKWIKENTNLNNEQIGEIIGVTASTVTDSLRKV